MDRDRPTYRFPADDLEDRVWNAIIAHTNGKQLLPTRFGIVRALCDRDRSNPFTPKAVGETIDDLIEHGIIGKTVDDRLRTGAKFRERGEHSW